MELHHLISAGTRVQIPPAPFTCGAVAQ